MEVEFLFAFYVYLFVYLLKRRLVSQLKRDIK